MSQGSGCTVRGGGVPCFLPGHIQMQAWMGWGCSFCHHARIPDWKPGPLWACVVFNRTNHSSPTPSCRAVVSVSWSAEFVRAALAQQGLPVVVSDSDGQGADVPSVSAVTVYANELEYFGDESTGNIRRRDGRGFSWDVQDWKRAEGSEWVWMPGAGRAMRPDRGCLHRARPVPGLASQRRGRTPCARLRPPIRCV